MTDYEEKIKKLKREEKELRLEILKRRLNRLDEDIIGAESLDEIELVSIKEARLKRRIAELEAEMGEEGVD
jgi:hypothetical protein